MTGKIEYRWSGGEGPAAAGQSFIFRYHRALGLVRDPDSNVYARLQALAAQLRSTWPVGGDFDTLPASAGAEPSNDFVIPLA